MTKISAPLLALSLILIFAPPAAAAEDEYAAVREQLETCFTCHGENGGSKDPKFPILAGQHMFYLYVQLKDFKAGRRASEVMSEFVAGLSKDEMRTIATFFSKQDWPKIGYRAEAEMAKAGARAASAGQCFQCHLGGYEGVSGVPRLAGQYPEYLNKTMLDFKTRRRNNAAAKSSLTESYSAEDIAAMAAYLGEM